MCNFPLPRRIWRLIIVADQTNQTTNDCHGIEGVFTVPGLVKGEGIVLIVKRHVSPINGGIRTYLQYGP